MSKLLHILVTICLLAFGFQAVEAKEYTFELDWHDQHFAWSEGFILNVADVASIAL